MVDSNLVESAAQQQNYYNDSIHTPLKPGQQVLLSNPCAGKLQPRWTGPWLVKETRGPSTVTLTMGDSERTVHINRIRLLLTEDTDSTEVKADWTPLCSITMRPLKITHQGTTFLSKITHQGVMWLLKKFLNLLC